MPSEVPKRERSVGRISSLNHPAVITVDMQFHSQNEHDASTEGTPLTAVHVWLLLPTGFQLPLFIWELGRAAH